MPYVSFSLKYRPRRFDDVIGQQHVARTLKNAIANNRVGHAYLFTGPRGTGKTSTARIFAAEPYDEGYRRAIEYLRDSLGICTLITGDIGRVDGHENWVRQCAEPLGVEVRTPLWDIASEAALTRMVEAGFDAVISCVRTDVLGVDWLGTRLTRAALERLVHHCRQTGIDPCGEQGEYHTLVMDGPGFGHRIAPGPWRVGHNDGLAYLQWG